MKRKIVLGIFILSILFFLLPWINISCMGTSVMTMNGVQMVTGTEAPGLSANSSTERIEPEILAIAIFVIALLGIIASIIRWREAFVARIVLGISGVILLIALKLKLDNQIQHQGEGMLEVNYLAGYWLTILAFIAVVVLSSLDRRSDLKTKKVLPLNEPIIATKDEEPTDVQEFTEGSGAPIMPSSSIEKPLRFSNSKEITTWGNKLKSVFLQKEQIQGYLANLDKLRIEGAVTEQSYTSTKTGYYERLADIQRQIAAINVPLNNELQLRNNDLMAYRTELENLKTRFKVGELPIENYRSSDRTMHMKLQRIESEVSYLQALVGAKSSTDISLSAPQVKQMHDKSSLLMTQSKRGGTLKTLGILICVLGTVIAILFVPCTVFGVFVGWHFILEDTGLGTGVYSYINATIFILELVLINAVGGVLIYFGLKRKSR